MGSELEKIDVCIPTWNSEPVLADTLSNLAKAEGEISVNRLIVLDNESDDATSDIACGCSDEFGWELVFRSIPCTLPEARKKAIDLVGTDWFLFLDDDVRISADYLGTLKDSTAPLVGAVQGRKESRTESNSDWVRRRSRRAGTHATLVRHEAVTDVDFPEDLVVLEDEYLRRYVENRGYLWVFNHQARFVHASMDRHPIGFQEGYLGGKYGLSKFHTVALNVPFSLMTGRNPTPHAMRAIGWLYGRILNKFS